MKYFYLSIEVSLLKFLINKKIVYTKKRYCVKLETVSCKKFKTTKTYLNETMFKNQEWQKHMC